MARADNRVFKIVLLVIGVVLFVLHLLLGPLFYYAPSFSGTVSDEQSGEPVQGAVVVAEWWLWGGTLHPRSKVLHYEEATTDESGHYTIDGWWPRLRPPTYAAAQSSPRVVAYRIGYVPTTLDEPRGSASWRFETFWDNKDIPLERHENNDEIAAEWRYAMEMTLIRLQRQLNDDCCPLLMKALTTRRKVSRF